MDYSQDWALKNDDELAGSMLLNNWRKPTPTRPPVGAPPSGPPGGGPPLSGAAAFELGSIAQAAEASRAQPTFGFDDRGAFGGYPAASFPPGPDSRPPPTGKPTRGHDPTLATAGFGGEAFFGGGFGGFGAPGAGFPGGPTGGMGFREQDLRTEYYRANMGRERGAVMRTPSPEYNGSQNASPQVMPKDAPHRHPPPMDHGAFPPANFGGGAGSQANWDAFRGALGPNLGLSAGMSPHLAPSSHPPVQPPSPAAPGQSLHHGAHQHHQQSPNMLPMMSGFPSQLNMPPAFQMPPSVGGSRPFGDGRDPTVPSSSPYGGGTGAGGWPAPPPGGSLGMSAPMDYRGAFGGMGPVGAPPSGQKPGAQLGRPKANKKGGRDGPDSPGRDQGHMRDQGKGGKRPGDPRGPSNMPMDMYGGQQGAWKGNAPPTGPPPFGAAGQNAAANSMGNGAARWKKPTAQEIADNMDEFARTHNGSRLVQQKIETASDDEKDIIIAAIMPDLPRHSSSVFGNYIVQRLLEHGTEKQLYAVLASLGGHIVTLSRDPYGCRVVQKALDAASRPGQLAILQEIQAGGVLEMIKDQSGNHVMQKAIERLRVEDIMFIVKSMEGNMQTIAVHLYGCRVTQRLFERVPVTMLQALFDELFPNFLELAQDQFGNYVLQHVAEFGAPQHRARAVEIVCRHLCTMACHKFASNVVEKVLTFGNATGHHQMLDAALSEGSSREEPPVLRMMKDRYGNYVVQKLLDTAFGDRREALLRLLQENDLTLKKFSYGKHILARIDGVP